MVTELSSAELISAPLSVTGRLIDASNATLYAEAKIGEVDIACIYKPVAGERPLWDFPDGTLANREYLTFLLSHWLDLHLVPPTILRDGPYGPGMVQMWIEIDPDIELMDLYLQDHPRLRWLALFDIIINNTDRKIGHLIPSTEGHLYGCDHGVTFHGEDKLRTVLWQWAGQRFTPAEIAILYKARELFEGSKREIIDSLIDIEEIEATIARIDRALIAGTFAEPSPDWPAVPWPPF
jgi:uncharacterized repeat protein (TIGR03843 family)